MDPPNDGRFPGGPTTMQIQLDRKAHRSERIWIGYLDYINPTSQYHGQNQVKMMTETNNARRQKLWDVGFGMLSSCNWQKTDLQLCFTIAERYWPRSCTFHFPVGEMTITLEDIYNIIGLPIDGNPLTCEKLKDYGPIIEKCLGKKPDDEKSCRTGQVKFKWLMSEFHTLPDNATDDEVDCYTRAYLLALCGHCLFPNSTGAYVNAHYLCFLEDLDEVKNYAWGAAVLAYLFKSLADFVMSKTFVNDIRGFLPILQVWSYLHFPSIGRPIVAPNSVHFPLLAKYCTGDRKLLQEPHGSAVIYRQEFDLLTHDKVIWAPYDILDGQMRLLYSHRACLIHMQTITQNPVDRCMRQFRCVQDIPEDPIWFGSMMSTANKKELNDARSAWAKRQERPYLVEGISVTDNLGVIHEATIRYLKWYGTPVMHNSGLRFEELRYTPKGYGDKVVDCLWKRSCEQADAVDDFRRRFVGPNGVGADCLLNIARVLRSRVPDTQWPLPQDEGIVRTRVVNWPSANTVDEQEPYIPHFAEGGDGDEEQRAEQRATCMENIDIGSRDDDMLSLNIGMYNSLHTPGSSSHTAIPHSPFVSTPWIAQMDPTEEEVHPRRSMRNIPHVHANILLCPYCSPDKRCANHANVS